MNRLRHALFLTALLAVAAAAPAAATPASTAEHAPDPGLVAAIDAIWSLERPGITTLAERMQAREGSDPPRFESGGRDGLAYVPVDGESARIEFNRRRLDVSDSPWGPLPRLRMDSARLLQISVPDRTYLALSGLGEGLFQHGDWRRYGFVHVVDITRRWAPVHYPLVAEAGLRERVIGRLPGSPVLNYLRVVPAAWDADGVASAYEVGVHALAPRGIEPVRTDGVPLAYRVDREPASGRWVLSRTHATPATEQLDRAGGDFISLAPRPRPPVVEDPSEVDDAAAEDASTATSD